MERNFKNIVYFRYNLAFFKIKVLELDLFYGSNLTIV